MNAGLGIPFVALLHQDDCPILIKLSRRQVNLDNLEGLVIRPMLGIHRVLLEQVVDGVELKTEESSILRCSRILTTTAPAGVEQEGVFRVRCAVKLEM